MKLKHNPFVVVHTGNVINVYLGNPDIIGNEAEFVLAIHEINIPFLIKALQNIGS